MKILVFGAGVIGTAVAWALSEAGHDVALLARPQRAELLAEGISIEMIDGRAGKKAPETRARFLPRVVTSINDDYDLVIVTVRHRQTADALEQIAPALGDGVVLFLTSNWEGVGFIDAVLSKRQYALGKVFAGGVLNGDVLTGAFVGELVLGSSVCGQQAEAETAAAAQRNVDVLVALFTEAGFKPKVIENMEQWNWVDFAKKAGAVCGAAQAGGLVPFVEDRRAIQAFLLAGRDGLAVCKARGADPKIDDDYDMFRMPTGPMSRLLHRVFRGEVSRRIATGYGAHSAEDLRAIYEDVVATGVALGVEMPHMLSHADEIQKLRDD